MILQTSRIRLKKKYAKFKLPHVRAAVISGKNTLKMCFHTWTCRAVLKYADLDPMRYLPLIPFLRHLLLIQFLLGHAIAAPLQRVAYDDAGEPAHQAHLIDGADWVFKNAGDATVAARSCVFGPTIRLGYGRLIAGAAYKVRLTLFADETRTMRVKAGQMVLGEAKAEFGKTTTVEFDVPAAERQGADLVLTIEKLSGPNAVVSEVEILSDNPAALAVLPDPSFDIPHLSPRPQQVAGVAQTTLDLGGTWHFSETMPPVFPPVTPLDITVWKKIVVPGEWAMQGFTVKPGDFAIYKRTIDVPGDWSDKTIKLRFDAVHAVCKVSVNARDIGGHEGGFVPFELDATQAIHPGRNEIIVRVQSESVADSIACISQYAAHQVGGIVRKVRLFCVPELHISEQWVETQLTGSDAVLQVHTKLDGSLGGKAAITHHLLDKDHKIVATARSPQPLLVPTPHLWTSETPYLYTLETTIGDPNKPTETLRQRIGLREIKVAGNQMFINGHPVKLLGVCRHEVHPLLGRSLTPALCRKDAELYRSANINLVRTSHYPPSEEFLTACDELGIFVECEAAVCWIKHGSSPVWNTWNHLDPKYLPYFMRANLDNVAANRNHPSVILWSLANESLWSPLFAEVLVAVKQADPTRPVTFHDQCWGGYNNGGSKGDLANYHYPAENNPDEWSQLSRPVWFGEYAHLQCYNRRELVTDPGIRDDWGRPLARMVDLIWQQPGCLGGAIWSGIDDVFHHPHAAPPQRRGRRIRTRRQRAGERDRTLHASARRLESAGHPHQGWYSNRR